jgi:hypothetical protein
MNSVQRSGSNSSIMANELVRMVSISACTGPAATTSEVLEADRSSTAVFLDSSIDHQSVCNSRIRCSVVSVMQLSPSCRISTSPHPNPKCRIMTRSTPSLLAASLLVALACGPAADARELPSDDLSLHPASSVTSIASITSDVLDAIHALTDQSAKLQCAPGASHFTLLDTPSLHRTHFRLSPMLPFICPD